MSFFDWQGIPEALIRSVDTVQDHENMGGSDMTVEDSDREKERLRLDITGPLY
jgi:hypothetical protein